MELNATDSELSKQFSCVACQFLVNNLHFIMYFIHRGQSPDRQQPIKEPSLRYFFFSWSLYLHLFKIAIYLGLGFIRDTTKFQFAFRSRIRMWNFIFEATNCRQTILMVSSQVADGSTRQRQLADV